MTRPPSVRPMGWIGLALLACLTLPAHAADPSPPEALGQGSPQAEHLATYIWRDDTPRFGGFSGIELSQDGLRFHALSDRGTIWWGQVERDGDGRITDMQIEGHNRLRDTTGKPLPEGTPADSEGIAIAPDGSILISFEGRARVTRYDTPDSPAQQLPSPPAFKKMQRNSSLEALAVTADGTVLTLPERSGALNRPFPVWRFRDGQWDQPFSVPRHGDWLPVGADVGPDGRFYLLERMFKGLLGFQSRVRRFDLAPQGLENEITLIQSGPLTYDNLEGISVWQDKAGLRISMISDDNFNFFQRTQIVEYRVTD